MSEDRVVNNEAEQRYELRAGDAVAIAAYRVEEGAILFTHTVVPDELEGRGVGTRLVAGALADIRDRGLKMVPLCSFVKHYVETHGDARELIA